jgi:hypothetical protein
MPSPRYGAAAIVLLAAALAGCGRSGSGDDRGANAPPRQDPVQQRPATSEGPIRDVVLRSYQTTDPADCERIFTTAFIHAAWQDADGCRKHLEQVAKLPPRTVRVIQIHRVGPVADARIRVDNIDSTVKLVLTGGQWQIDDTVGQGGSARTNLEQSREEAAKREGPETPVALGKSIRFAPIAGIGPHVNFSVTVLKVVPAGFARNGVSSGDAAIVDDFGTVTNKGVRYRVVNIQVRVRNHGPAPFRGTFSGTVIGTGGRTWPAAQHVGRQPDWTDGERRGIKPGHSAARWLTVAMPAAGLPSVIELTPEVLSGPNTVAAVQPAKARWRAR